MFHVWFFLKCFIMLVSKQFAHNLKMCQYVNLSSLNQYCVQPSVNRFAKLSKKDKFAHIKNKRFNRLNLALHIVLSYKKSWAKMRMSVIKVFKSTTVFIKILSIAGIHCIFFELLRFKEVFYSDLYLEFNIFFLFLSRFFFSHFWYVLVFH